MVGNRLIIGLDYGTTFTGVSFCETTDTEYAEDRIQIVQDWKSVISMIGTKEKVPSEIAYTDNGIKWGAEIPPHTKRYRWTKLQLENTSTGEAEKIHEEMSSLSTYGAAAEKPPVEIVADFLSGVKTKLIENLDRQYGTTLWKTLPITLVITVPAVWSDAAKDRTMQAVRQAGFNTVDLPQLRRTTVITEPEAAAIYTIKSWKGSVHDAQLALGDGFVVCDMGGGTIDLISYRVAGIEPTVVEEATIGTGDQCGGTFVDKAFLQWLEDKLGLRDFVKLAGCSAKDLSRTSLPPKVGKLLQTFTTTSKSGFSGTEEYYLALPVSLGLVDDEERGISDGEIEMTASDMIQMFEFPLRRTRELLLEQLHQVMDNGSVSIKYIFMVGGFAESPYMYRQISVITQAYSSIQVIKPMHAWSAIARGAAAKGLESDGRTLVQFRKCRRHYGTKCNTLFVHNEHRESDSFICPYTNSKRAGNQVDWLIHKGQDLATNGQAHGTLYLGENWWGNKSKIACIRFYATDTDKAPSRSEGPNVNKIAELRINLNSVPESEFDTHYNSAGRMFQRLVYAVEISVQSTLEFSLSVKGIKYGSVTANYA